MKAIRRHGTRQEIAEVEEGPGLGVTFLLLSIGAFCGVFWCVVVMLVL